MVQNYPNFPKWSNMVGYCPIQLKIVFKSLNLSKMAQNWSKKVHKVPVHLKLFHKMTAVNWCDIS